MHYVRNIHSREKRTFIRSRKAKGRPDFTKQNAEQLFFFTVPHTSKEKKKTKVIIAYAFNSAVQLYSSLFTLRTEETTLLRVFTKRKHSSFAQTRIKRQVQSFTSRLRYHCSSASALSKGAGASQAGKRPALPARSCPSSPSSCSMTRGGRADGQPPASP